jgi:hypothetical protein
MKLHYLVFPIAVIASGCGITPASQPVAQKSAAAVCATTGAALQSMVVAGATGALAKIKPEAEILYPICSASTPSGAVSAAEAGAYTRIIEAAAPYLGGAQ